MAKGDPNIPMDPNKTGDDALWAEVEHYLRWKDDHTMMFNREFFRKIVPFLAAKAKYKQEEAKLPPMRPIGKCVRRLLAGDRFDLRDLPILFLSKVQKAIAATRKKRKGGK